jgi:hypothetical protein
MIRIRISCLQGPENHVRSELDHSIDSNCCNEQVNKGIACTCITIILLNVLDTLETLPFLLKMVDLQDNRANTLVLGVELIRSHLEIGIENYSSPFSLQNKQL